MIVKRFYLKYRIVLIAFWIFLLPLSGFAQTLTEGLRMLDYQRYSSAKQMLEKTANREPANAEAWYWLAQVYLQQPDHDAARARTVLQNGLAKNKNHPLLQAGLLHVDLLEEKISGTDEQIRQLYNTNIANTSVAKALARAMIIEAFPPKYHRLRGEPMRTAYARYKQQVEEAISLCKELKTKDGETYLLLGDGYRKLLGESFSNAFQQYRLAEAFPEYKARALYQQGRLFMVIKDRQLAGKYLEDAVLTDPSYAPAYLTLYELYIEMANMAQAKTSFEKYLQYADMDCNNELYYAGFLNRSGKYQEGLNKANSLLNGECRDKSRIHLLIALSQEGLKNVTAAREAIDSYLQKEKAEEVGPYGYEVAGRIYAALPGEEKQALKFYQQALEADTSVSGKLTYFYKMEPLVKKTGDAEALFSFTEKRYQLKPNPSNRDLYDYAQAALGAGKYSLSETLFGNYISKYPDQYYGYYGRGNARWQLDPDGKLGLAVQDFEKFESLVIAEKEKYRSQLLKAYAYLAGYYVNSGTDKTKGISYLRKYLELDPTNQQMKNALEKLEG